MQTCKFDNGFAGLLIPITEEFVSFQNKLGNKDLFAYINPKHGNIVLSTKLQTEEVLKEYLERKDVECIIEHPVNEWIDKESRPHKLTLKCICDDDESGTTYEYEYRIGKIYGSPEVVTALRIPEDKIKDSFDKHEVMKYLKLGPYEKEKKVTRSDNDKKSKATPVESEYDDYRKLLGEVSWKDYGNDQFLGEMFGGEDDQVFSKIIKDYDRFVDKISEDSFEEDDSSEYLCWGLPGHSDKGKDIPASKDTSKYIPASKDTPTFKDIPRGLKRNRTVPVTTKSDGGSLNAKVNPTTSSNKGMRSREKELTNTPKTSGEIMFPQKDKYKCADRIRTTFHKNTELKKNVRTPAPGSIYKSEESGALSKSEESHNTKASEVLSKKQTKSTSKLLYRTPTSVVKEKGKETIITFESFGIIYRYKCVKNICEDGKVIKEDKTFKFVTSGELPDSVVFERFKKLIEDDKDKDYSKSIFVQLEDL